MVVYDQLNHSMQETCISCGCVFSMPKDLWDQYKKSGNSFHCPNGHQQCYPKVDKVAEAEKKIVEIENQLASMRGDRDRYQRLYYEEQRKYHCCVTGCDYNTVQKHRLRQHLDKAHSMRPVRALLPANAGPNAKNTEVG